MTGCKHEPSILLVEVRHSKFHHHPQYHSQKIYIRLDLGIAQDSDAESNESEVDCESKRLQKMALEEMFS